MECPECKTGQVRVIVGMTCSCNHNMMMCDSCFKALNVPCGPPYNQSALPPELPLLASDDFRRAWQLGQDHAKATSEADKENENSQTYEDSMKLILDEMPTVEEFKQQLAVKAAESSAT